MIAQAVEARGSAEHCGGDLPDPGRLPTERGTEERYIAAVEDCVIEAAGSRRRRLPLHFAVILATDRLIAR
jgi:hypothetical protein